MGLSDSLQARMRAVERGLGALRETCGLHEGGLGMAERSVSPEDILRADWSKRNWLLGVVFAATMVVPLVVLSALDLEVYWLSVWFGVFFVGLSDPGGDLATRCSVVAVFALIGALFTAWGIWVGAQGWGLVAASAFVVVLGSGLALHFGVRRFVTGTLLSAWFLIAISLPPGFAAAGVTLDPALQALAWLVGAASWLVVSSVVWLAARRSVPQPQLVSELPADTTVVAITRPMAAYAVIRAVAVGGAVAIAFGFELPYADWMPIAALIAMKTSLQQSTLAAVQRVVGTILGAAIAIVVLLSVNDEHVLGVAVLACALVGGALRTVNYALYTMAVAGAALIALDIADPTNLATEGQRVLFTLIGVVLAIGVTILAGKLQHDTPERSNPEHRPS